MVGRGGRPPFGGTGIIGRFGGEGDASTEDDGRGGSNPMRGGCGMVPGVRPAKPDGRDGSTGPLGRRTGGNAVGRSGDFPDPVGPLDRRANPGGG